MLKRISITLIIIRFHALRFDASTLCDMVDFYHDIDVFLHRKFDSLSNFVEVYAAY